jgi:hypothetical protein
VGWSEAEDLLPDEVVVQDGVRVFQHADRFEGQ